MAKAPSKPEAAGGQAAPKTKSKLVLVLVSVLVLVALLVGGALAGLWMLKSKGSDEQAAASAAAASPSSPAAAPVDLSKPPAFVELDPFTVNLRGDEGDHYLQVVLALRVADVKTADSLKAFMPEIRHRINILLSGKLPSEVGSSEGREQLAVSIMDEANAALGFPATTDVHGRLISNGPVQAVLFNSFIIQ